MKLINTTQNKMIIDNLKRAETFSSRLVGLLGHKNLPDNEALWILNCPSIHTFFMKFAIDVVFLDRKMTVKACYENMKPWRMVWPVWGAYSVVEMAAGSIRKFNIQVGDQLNVVQ